MFLGLLVVIAGIVWLCTRPSLSLKAQMLQSRSMVPASGKAGLEEKGDNSQQVQDVETPPIGSARIHVVVKGETLSTICQRYYGSTQPMRRVIEINHIQNPDRLRPGTKLIIPE